MKEKLLCLRELPLFQGLSEAEFNTICPGKINKSVAKGDFLFRQGEYDPTIYLIKSGKLKLIQNNEDGREIIISIVGSGQVLGESALFQESELQFSAVALEDAKLCGFNRQGLEMIIQQNPDFAIKIINHLAWKLNTTMQQVSESSAGSVREKLLRLLIRFANEYGKTISDMVIIELNITQQDMANMIGASRVKVAQVLKEFRSAGILSRHGRYYMLKTDFCVKNSGILG
ncbi:MAG: Crp/Fnr family transcriptional regulator [Firmicutes bacterium HGW-Firmicutes-14]|jgi:CRP/FNR family transcriptional regulator|nr:MAG: Crp/Fnr family transcriptional regulator [Firmicutes bacterium HGW-Firmicutes-14]